MFVLKDKLARIAMGSVVTSFLALATFMPVSAASANDFQIKEESKAFIAMQEEVQEGSSCLNSTDLPADKAAAQISGMDNGKSRQIMVWPKANPRENGMHEAAAPTDEAGAVAEEETTAPADEEEAVAEEETTAPAGEEEAVAEEEAAAPAGEEEAVAEEEIAAPVGEEEAVAEEEAAAPADEEGVRIGVHNKLLNSYDKLLDIYEQMVGYFGTIYTN